MPCCTRIAICRYFFMSALCLPDDWVWLVVCEQGEGEGGRDGSCWLRRDRREVRSTDQHQTNNQWQWPRLKKKATPVASSLSS